MKKIVFMLMVVKATFVLGQNQSITAGNPLILANGIETDSKSSVFNSKNIELVNVQKGEKAIEIYGEKGINGVLEMKLKPTARLLNQKDFFARYRISQKDQNLPIVLNKQFINQKERLLLDASVIKSVKVLDEQPFWEPVLLPKGRAIYIEAPQK